MKPIYIFVLLIIIGVSCKSIKENSHSRESKYNEQLVRDNFRIMFYNVENLFDTINDPNKRDDEFTPSGERFWTGYRYYKKLVNISKVIIGVGEWELPQIVGLSEVENITVLNDLLNKTPLYKSDYKIIHHESPDARGIDVALLYREKFFKPISNIAIPIIWPKRIGTGTTRDILYVKGLTKNNDTLHIFVNHWPSRWGGQMETEEKRMYVASLVKNCTDSIFKTNSKANIVIMGDLNDYPTDKSLIYSLKAETEYEKIKTNKLYNLSFYLQEIKKIGSHKYSGQWGVLDQIIVSGSLLDSTNNIKTSLEDIHIYRPDFMMEPDEKNTGKTVSRTYIGYKYNGGYSDHLPTFIDIKKTANSTPSF